MNEQRNEASTSQQEEFARQARGERRGLLREYLDLVLTSRKYWLAPIILVLLILAGLILVSGTAVAPMLYTLF